MAFENLSEQIKESLTGIKSRITESESYNRLLEAYNNLPSRQQRLLILVGSLLGVLILLNIPLQSFLVSQEELQKYKEQKDLVQRLNFAAQLKSQADFQPERFDMGRLQGDLLGRMKSFQVTEDQFKLSPTTADSFGIPKQAVTSGYNVSLTNLNVRQISRIAGLLENYSDSILVTGFKSTASSEDPHYFNTEFKLLNFSVPEDESDVPTANPSFRGR